MAGSATRAFRQKVEVAFLRAFGAVAGLLPFSWASALGAGMGRLAYAVLGRRRRIAVQNITAAFGASVDGVPAAEIARRVFVQIGRTFVEFLALPALGPERLAAKVDLIGYEPVFERARERRGMVLVTAHYGNWELLGAAVRAHGTDVRYLLPPQTNPGSDAYIDAVRRRLGITPVKIGYGMRDAFRALRNGVLLGILPDQDARRVGIHVPFFGRPASTHTGPARLAYRAGCPVGIGFIERVSGGRFRSRLVAILHPDLAAEESAEVERLTRAMTAEIEAAVRRRPDHWYWIHRRWKTPPPTGIERPSPPLEGSSATT